MMEITTSRIDLNCLLRIGLSTETNKGSLIILLFIYIYIFFDFVTKNQKTTDTPFETHPIQPQPNV